MNQSEVQELAENRRLHVLHARRGEGPNVWLECQQCPAMYWWDGQGLSRLIDGDQRFGHSGSW